MGRLKYLLTWYCRRCGYGREWKSDVDTFANGIPRICPNCRHEVVDPKRIVKELQRDEGN